MHARSCPTLCYPMDHSPTKLLCPWDSPGKNTKLGSHALLQGIFPTQGSNPYLLKLLHCRGFFTAESYTNGRADGDHERKQLQGSYYMSGT